MVPGGQRAVARWAPILAAWEAAAGEGVRVCDASSNYRKEGYDGRCGDELKFPDVAIAPEAAMRGRVASRRRRTVR